MDLIVDRIIKFNRNLDFDSLLPEGVGVINPFLESEAALEASSAFYRKFYSDNNPRLMILGINPGRFGAGLTGVPFTDPKRLMGECGVDCYSGPSAHEPSSVFIYEMINCFGGVQAFYSQFYINSICPLGFVAKKPNGKEVNYNYYDNSELAELARPFILKTLRKQMKFNIRREVCFCLGTGKNMKFVSALNKEFGFFEKIVPLEHPRYIIQYKSKQVDFYINKYLEVFREYIK